MFWVWGFKGESHLDPGEVTGSRQDLHREEATQENEGGETKDNIQ